MNDLRLITAMIVSGQNFKHEKWTRDDVKEIVDLADWVIKATEEPTYHRMPDYPFGGSFVHIEGLGKGKDNE